MALTDQPLPEIVTDPVETAKAAGLRYVSDSKPGIRRVPDNDGEFRYIGPDGKDIDDQKTLERIRSLRIPPAWTEVWICPISNGHIQATGRDAKRRKQYIYHPQWRCVRDENKFGSMIAFGLALPEIRRRVVDDLAKPGLPREKVLATVVQLLESTLIRVGNEEYARTNRSYGLTTLRDRHVKVEGSRVCFQFRGKKGKLYEVGVRDRKLAQIVRRSQELPGQELFQYVDDSGEPKSIGSSDVNDYLREITGDDFTAKDFRTWTATVLAALALQEFEAFDGDSRSKGNIVQAVKQVAGRLGNTPAICRKSYIHPAIIDSYTDGTLADSLRDRIEAEGETLRVEEAAILRLLQRRLDEEAARETRAAA